MPTTSPSKARAAVKATPAGRKQVRIAAAGPKSAAPVRVRMFRQGLGDCFLLTFNPAGEARHVMIDCGTLGAKTTGVTLKQVADEIAATVGAKGIDLLIATHEHWDHVSGFAPGTTSYAVLSQIPVKLVWLAWTENPADRLAQALATEKADLGRALQFAMQAMQAAPAGDRRCAAAREAVAGIDGFNDGPLGAAGISQSVNAAMDAVRRAFKAPVVYREPGDKPLEHPWLKGFRIYVLGPPRSRESLTRLGEHGSADLYGLSPGVRAALAAAGAVPATDIEPEDEMPFAARCRHPIDADATRTWYPEYFADGQAWRRIEGDWLHAAADDAERLALQLDSLTNNTSLAIAIERVADGKVLLFPADAQEGNWLSWHEPEIRWQVPDGHGGTKDVTAAGLLDRTVFYKVGHHASHNATASAKGLELMKGSGLTAFIPVDRAVALSRNPKGSWRMPARKLYRRLLEKCEGRVLRSDIGWAAPVKKAKPSDTEKEFESLGTDAEWQAWKQAQAAAGHIRVAPTHIEYTLL